MLRTLKQWVNQDATVSKGPTEERGPTNQGLEPDHGKDATERLVEKRMALEEGSLGVHMDGGETTIGEQNCR